jgi:hypothetical protein
LKKKQGTSEYHIVSTGSESGDKPLKDYRKDKMLTKEFIDMMVKE